MYSISLFLLLPSFLAISVILSFMSSGSLKLKFIISIFFTSY